jgi:hypothetical protein
MLVARGSAGDRQRAQQLLKQALTVYRELGMQPSTARASR